MIDGQLYKRRPELRPLAGVIEEAYTRIVGCLERKGCLYLCGNGGSAADADHWSGEMLKGFYHRRRVTEMVLPPELERLQGGLPAIPLSGFTALRTAVTNDIGADLDYAQLIWVLGRAGDVLVAISTSGMARNVLLATQAARCRGLVVLGLTGAGGGELEAEVDLCIRVPAVQTHLIQELHLSVYHEICLALERHFFPEPTD